MRARVTRRLRPRCESAAQRCIGPSVASCWAIWKPHWVKRHAREPNAKCRASRRRCWWQPPARSRHKDAPDGRWTCWLARWSSSPSTSTSHAKRCAGDWRRTMSSPGARTCGAFLKWMAPMWPGWRTCSISTPRRPIRSIRWCFDESPTQLTGEVRQPIPAQPGQPERYDCEYHRNGTANLFVFLDAHRSWREVKVTDQRTAADFAHCMRDLVDVHYPQAELIRVVMDNLSTHTAGALYETFPAPEAHRVLQRLEFHYTPKHASWLNMVEIEIGVLRTQCLDRRIGERERLLAEIQTWQQQRNASGARVKWMFTTERARRKLARVYPNLGKES